MAAAKILFVTPSAYTLSGLATWLDYMEPGLVSLGWDVTIGLVEGARYHCPDKYLARHQHKNWISISCRSHTGEGRLRAVEKVLDRVKPDIIATVNIPDAVLGAARWRKKHHRALKIVMTVHGIQPDLYDDMASYACLLDAVCCTNRLACQLAEKLGCMGVSRVHYVPYGVHEVDCALQTKNRRACLRIAYVGRLEQDQKRVLDLSPIVAGLDKAGISYQLLIAGSGPEEENLRVKLKHQIDDGSVQFLGFLQPVDLQKRVLEQVDILLLTSSWETGPLVIWEAMSNAVAVVSSKYIGSGLEGALIHEKNALMFDVGDTRMAIQALTKLWHDENMLRKLGNQGLAMVSSRYSISASISKWDVALHSILSSSTIVADEKIAVQPSEGRLTRMFGEHYAENLRQGLHLTGSNTDAGGEWPHSHGKTANDDKGFWSLVKYTDAVGSENPNA